MQVVKKPTQPRSACHTPPVVDIDRSRLLEEREALLAAREWLREWVAPPSSEPEALAQELAWLRSVRRGIGLPEPCRHVRPELEFW